MSHTKYQISYIHHFIYLSQKPYEVGNIITSELKISDLCYSGWIPCRIENKGAAESVFEIKTI